MYRFFSKPAKFSTRTSFHRHFSSSSVSSARKASLVSLSSQSQNSGSSSESHNVVAMAAAAAGLLGIGGMMSMCEKNMKDPMTMYASKDMDLNVQDTNEDSPTKTENEGIPLIEIKATSAKDEKTLAPLSLQEAQLESRAQKAKRHSGALKLFSGNGNMALALEIAQILGINLGKATVGKFADGEINVMIHENVRGKDAYVIQPTCPPVNDNLMELLLLVSTLNRASARRVTVVMPYYGYARQDRKMQVGFFL